MPYILVRGNLASYGHRYPWRVLVSGLKGIILYFEIQILILLIIFKYNILLYIILHYHVYVNNFKNKFYVDLIFN